MANVTVISPEIPTFAFDTGQGNVLIDYYTKKFFNQDYDEGGMIASQGKIDDKWLEYLAQNDYYRLKPPKTTGRELFTAEYAENALGYSLKTLVILWQQ